jgi:hypothetical protein
MSQPESTRSEARPGDVSSVDAILKALYEAISFPPGGEPDWGRLRSLFHSGARMIPAKQPGDALRVFDLDDWIVHARERMRSLGLPEKGFVEWELARTAETFGTVAHAFSTYESRHPDAGPPFARGINSIQLVCEAGRWWVLTVFWDVERQDNPIPAKYL